MSKRSKKYILEHLECDGHMDISDFPEFLPSDVDNFVTNVDNIPDPICAPLECVRCYWVEYCYPSSNA